MTHHFRITPEALAALAAAAIIDGNVVFGDGSQVSHTDDESGLVLFMISDRTTEAIEKSVPWLDMNNPIQFSEWIIEAVSDANFKEGESN